MMQVSLYRTRYSFTIPFLCSADMSFHSSLTAVSLSLNIWNIVGGAEGTADENALRLISHVEQISWIVAKFSIW